MVIFVCSPEATDLFLSIPNNFGFHPNHDATEMPFFFFDFSFSTLMSVETINKNALESMHMRNLAVTAYFHK